MANIKLVGYGVDTLILNVRYTDKHSQPIKQELDEKLAGELDDLLSMDGFRPLHEYLTKHRPYLAHLGGRLTAHKEDAVFLCDDGHPVTTNTVSKLFERLQRKTGIEGKRVSAHNCRRYMATTQLAMGRSPLDVQRQMGHTTLTLTNRYGSLTIAQLQQSHDLYSPLRAKNMSDTQQSMNGYWDE